MGPVEQSFGLTPARPGRLVRIAELSPIRCELPPRLRIVVVLHASSECPGDPDRQVGLTARSEPGRNPAAVNHGLGLEDDREASLARGRQTREVTPAVGVGGDRCVNLQTRRRHLRHQQPVLGVADLLPAALGRPAGI